MQRRTFFVNIFIREQFSCTAPSTSPWSNIYFVIIGDGSIFIYLYIAFIRVELFLAIKGAIRHFYLKKYISCNRQLTSLPKRAKRREGARR